MSIHHHTVHFHHRPLSPLAFAQRHVKAVHRLNLGLMVIAILGMVAVGLFAILLLFQATAAH